MSQRHFAKPCLMSPFPVEHLTEFEHGRRRLVLALPFRSVRATTQSALSCGNPTRPSERTKNGWSRNPNPQASVRINLLDEERLPQLSRPGVSKHFASPSPKVEKIAAASECDDDMHRGGEHVVYY